MKTFTRRANAGTNITLLSICDLAALRPPSECSLTMENCRGEGGSSLGYSVIYWWYTSSRTGDSIQTVKEWENPVPVCSAQENCDGADSSLLHQIGHENFDKRQNKHLESLQTLHGAEERTFPSPSLSLRYPGKFRDLEPCFQAPHKQQQSPEPPPTNTLAFFFAPPGVSHSVLHCRTSASDKAQKPHGRQTEAGICHWAEVLFSSLY